MERASQHPAFDGLLLGGLWAAVFFFQFSLLKVELWGAEAYASPRAAVLWRDAAAVLLFAAAQFVARRRTAARRHFYASAAFGALAAVWVQGALYVASFWVELMIYGEIQSPAVTPLNRLILFALSSLGPIVGGVFALVYSADHPRLLFAKAADADANLRRMSSAKLASAISSALFVSALALPR